MVSYERQADIRQAFLTLCCALICANQLARADCSLDRYRARSGDAIRFAEAVEEDLVEPIPGPGRLPATDLPQPPRF